MRPAQTAEKRALLLALALLASSAQAETVVSETKGKVFNPDIGVNLLGLIQRGTGLSDDRTEFNRNGIQLEEAEFQFSANVDPYLRAVALFSVSQNHGEWGIDPEEVYAETISLPQFTLRAGKFKLALGKHNQLHTHAFPFIDAPLINQELLGNEGLNEAAVSAAWLAPTDWYMELIVQAYDPSNEVIFGGHAGDIGGLARLKNLFDLTEDLTAELGISGTAAKKAASAVTLGQEQTASILGADLTFKWRPSIRGKYHALIWQSEYLYGYRVPEAFSLSDDVRFGGLASWIQYQFAERWWLQARAEHTGWPNTGYTFEQDKQSGLLGFLPTEFSGFRVQYDHLATHNQRDEHTLAFQFNVSIGAHPAHAY
jgi:hypothetical protein